jgi:hypothetical protein
MRKLLLIIALLVLPLFAYADSGIVLPDTFGGGAAVATWMGFTTLTYDGNQTDYYGANALCNADYAGSHVCTVDEMLSLVNSGAALPATGEGWINGGPPGYTANANDCQGWSVNAVGNYGRYWDFVNDQGWMRGCSNSVAFACCK